MPRDQTSAPPPFSGIGKTLFKLLLVFGVFWFLAHEGFLDIDALAASTRHPWLIAGSVGLMTVWILISVERWRVLLASQAVTLPYGQATRVTLIGLFFNLILPGTVSGDLIKYYYISRGGGGKGALFSSVLLDRFIGLYSTFLAPVVIGLFFYLFQERIDWWSDGLDQLLLVTTLLFLAMNVGLYWLQSRRLVALLMHLLRSRRWLRSKALVIMVYFRRYRKQPRLLTWAFLISLFSQALLYLAFWLLALALETEGMTFGKLLLALPLCFLINAIPLSPGGMGIGELGFGAVFYLVGMDKGVELAALFHGINILQIVIMGGAAYLLHAGGVNLKRGQTRA